MNEDGQVKVNPNRGLQDLLKENQLYEDAVREISKKVSLKEAMERASDVLS